jgi:hypothetical protein
MEPSPTRRAKEAFVIAEMVKAGPLHSPEAFLASMENLEREVTSWTDNEIDSFMARENPHRLANYNRAQWKSDTVELQKCTVWPRMGRREWAEGNVTTVADLFRRHEPQQSRIWDMQKFGEIFSSRLPIIVFLVGPSSIMIDDGSHRAVAMALADIKSSLAWIGLL